MRRPARGEIWYHEPKYTLPGNLYNKARPVVIIGDNALNFTSPTILVAPCTRQSKKYMKSHALFTFQGNVNTVMTEQSRPVLVEDLINYKTTLPADVMLRVDAALINAFGIQQYIKEEYTDVLN